MKRSLEPHTLQVLRSISLCRFSCSSDSFSFWTKLFMCTGKSSADKYSPNTTNEVQITTANSFKDQYSHGYTENKNTKW